MWLLHFTLLLFVLTTVFVYSVVEPLEARDDADDGSGAERRHKPRQPPS